jgi:hypothetical protein
VTDREPPTLLDIKVELPTTRTERALFIALYAIRIGAFAAVCAVSFAVCTGHF